MVDFQCLYMLCCMCEQGGADWWGSIWWFYTTASSNWCCAAVGLSLFHLVVWSCWQFVKIPFCCPYCCVRVFPDFALRIILLSKLRLRDEREQSIWWKNVLLQGASPWDTSLCIWETVCFSSAMLASRSKTATWVLWGSAPVCKFLTLLSAQLGEVGISLLWVYCQCRPQD